MQDTRPVADNTSSVINANSDGAPFSSCPTEVLSRIFELLRNDRERAGSLDWLVPCNSVSRHWRATALGHQYLWSYLNPLALSRGLLDVFLNRSGAAPLVVLIGAWPGAKGHVLRQAYIQILSTQLHRVQSLVYEDTETTWQLIPAEEIALLLRDPAPLLHVLSLPGSKRSKQLFKEASALGVFLSNCAQNVQDVVFRQFPSQCFPWRSPPTSIRSLVLSVDSSVENTSPLTLVATLASLRLMPTLESLSLSGFASKAFAQRSPPIANSEHVHLPRLQVLRLTGNSDQYALMWKCITMHPLCSVQLEIVHIQDYPATLRSALVRHLAQSDTSTLTEMVVKKNAATMLAFSLYPPGQPPNEVETSKFTHPSVDIFVAWEKPLVMAPHLPAVQVMLATPITTIERLTLDAFDVSRVDPEHMADIAPLARSVEVLTLRSFRSPMLSAAFLGIGGVFTSSRSISGLPFPRLREVALARCEFDLDVAAPAVRDALTRRALAGAQLEKISFVSCGLEPGRSEELEKELVQSGLVECVVCEGDEE
ncbi:hypothetical protein PENSPDRAFT_686667 [Peniophora sp. CONT]|nr:hypothetical protein PENSPDRAFT_686667 [Peniophora sp. CONT]